MTPYAALFEGRDRQVVREVLVLTAAIVLLAVSARAAIPFYPVPLTLQSLVAIGLGLTLGPARGAAAVLAYLGFAAAGLPVLAGTPERGIGLAYMAGPTGGYLAGFVLAALVAGMLSARGWSRTPWQAALAALAATIALYVPALLWLGLYTGYGPQLLEAGVYPFMPGDLFKAGLAAAGFPLAWAALERALRA